MVSSPHPGAGPGINYEGQKGVHNNMNMITKDRRGAQEYEYNYEGWEGCTRV